MNKNWFVNTFINIFVKWLKVANSLDGSFLLTTYMDYNSNEFCINDILKNLKIDGSSKIVTS